jgi:hypothetical protein
MPFVTQVLKDSASYVPDVMPGRPQIVIGAPDRIDEARPARHIGQDQSGAIIGTQMFNPVVAALGQGVRKMAFERKANDVNDFQMRWQAEFTVQRGVCPSGQIGNDPEIESTQPKQKPEP